MRKPKREHRALPYVAGIAAGYAAALVLSAVAALLLLMSGTTEIMSGAAGLLVTAGSSFFAGRATGKLRRRDGLKCGAVSGILFMLPLAVLGMIFGRAGIVMLLIKAVICVVFGATGGVVGVNSDNGDRF